MSTKKGVRQPFPGGNIRNWELVARILEKEVKMCKKEILKARKVCHFHLMRCSKEEVIECFLDFMETNHPKNLISIAERAREEIRI